MPAPQEDWSRRGFYQTMLCLFIHRSSCQVPEDHAPFFLQDQSRRLTEAQYKGAQGLYVQWQSRAYRLRGLRGTSSGVGIEGGREDVRWPDPIPGEEPYTITEAHRALGRLFFTRTKAGQAKARAEVRALATRGPVARRRALRAAVAATPQAKATQSPQDLLFKIVPFRAGRQFMWHFLRAELFAAIRRKSTQDEVRPLRAYPIGPSQHEGEARGIGHEAPGRFSRQPPRSRQ